MVKTEKYLFRELNTSPGFFTKLMCDAMSLQTDSCRT